MLFAASIRRIQKVVMPWGHDKIDAAHDMKSFYIMP